MRFIIVLLFSLYFPLGACAQAADAKLDILVTNDDGWDAPGISAVAEALAAAGHRVTIVAPLAQQSGVGVKITLGEYAAVEQRPGVWTVDGSPADAVSFALNHVLAGRRPDLVVSGANLGQNLGTNVVSSGTVGAAIMAVFNDVPGIAVSTGILLAEAGTSPERFPSTRAAYPATAAMTVELVRHLLAHRQGAGPLLPPRVVLNLNYPVGQVVKGLKLARLGRYGGFQLAYPPVDKGAKVVSTMAVDARALAEEGSDTALFDQGYATLSILVPDWGAPRAAARGVETLLEELIAPAP